MDCSPPGSSVHGDSPGKNTGVGCHALLQGIFPTQESNQGLLHCRQILYSRQNNYQGWNRSPAQVGCMRQVLRAGALGRPRGMGWGGRREGALGWGTHVNPWLIHVSVWQKPLQCCEVISLQLRKINGGNKRQNKHCQCHIKYAL